jgi:hypothetical protein
MVLSSLRIIRNIKLRKRHHLCDISIGVAKYFEVKLKNNFRSKSNYHNAYTAPGFKLF